MTDFEVPGPPLRGFAITLSEDRPAYNQKKGYFLKIPVSPPNQTWSSEVPIDFTPEPQRVFGSQAEASDVRDQLKTAKGINTEVVYI